MDVNHRPAEQHSLLAASTILAAQTALFLLTPSKGMQAEHAATLQIMMLGKVPSGEHKFSTRLPRALRLLRVPRKHLSQCKSAKACGDIPAWWLQCMLLQLPKNGTSTQL